MSLRMVSYDKLDANQLNQFDSMIEDAYIEHDGQRYFHVAIMNSEVAGVVSCEPEGGYLTLIVAEKFQGMGVATALIDKLIETAKAQGFNYLAADAIHPATVKICKRFNFIHEGNNKYALYL